MSHLIISVNQNNPTVYTATAVNFIGGTETQVKNVNVPYTNGKGISLTAGQTLGSYTSNGSNIVVKSLTAQTITNSGTLQLSVEHNNSPGSTTSPHNISFIIGGVTGILNVSYSYRPATLDITATAENRSTIYIKDTDILPKVSDSDGTVTHIAFTGDVTGLYLSNVAYTAGSWILISSLSSNVLNYRADDTDNAYTKQITYKVKDNSGLESN